MRLTPKNMKTKVIIYAFFGLFVYTAINANVYMIDTPETALVDANDLIRIAEGHYNNKEYRLASEKFREALNRSSKDSIYLFKKLAFSYAKSDQPELAGVYVEKYVLASLDLDFVSHSNFWEIKSSMTFQKLSDKYIVKIDTWSIFCFYVGFIGLFIAVVLNFRKRSDRVANMLMSIFILLHSFFILHISLLLTNYRWYVPHTLYMSTGFSLLYGPLIYFYFKRATSKYKFKTIDLLHLIPTVLLIVVLLVPVYLLPEAEKSRMQLHKTAPHTTLITVSKLISLIVYGIMVLQIYYKSIKNNKGLSKVQFSWQRNIASFSLLYILTYSVYAFLIISKIFNGFLFNMQVGLMALLVLYVGYTAFVRPSVFGKLKLVPEHKKAQEKIEFNKYEKSGLTESLSLELKHKLLQLLNEQKVYRQNDITLQKLANMLDTTRHNASQIINEHFDLNFFDLINTYRIQEAMSILKKEKTKKLNIIDVAYEVGFNNKVTFNKSFKKYNHITPSEYLKSQVA